MAYAPRHNGPTVLGPRFTRTTIRHGNRPVQDLRDTILLEPDDDDEPTEHQPGRHRRDAQQPR